MAIDTTSPRTRRALLTAGFGAVAATVATAIGRVSPVYAAGPVVLGTTNESDTTTTVTVDGFDQLAAFHGDSSSGDGIVGFSGSGRGVWGNSSSNYGVEGEGNAAAGVFGHSRSAPGVIGRSELGRGAVFGGKKAQVRLDPSDAASHPHTGSMGDMFVDKTGRLWFCKGSTSWTKLA
jgi:hypothetical protein